jgi:hypothetical protein
VTFFCILFRIQTGNILKSVVTIHIYYLVTKNTKDNKLTLGLAEQEDKEDNHSDVEEEVSPQQSIVSPSVCIRPLKGMVEVSSSTIIKH